jgi:hypothetical protein
LHPALDSGDDAITMGGPHEGFGIAIGLSEKAVDCGLKFDAGAEHTAFEPSSGRFREEALDRVEP